MVGGGGGGGGCTALRGAVRYNGEEHSELPDHKGVWRVTCGGVTLICADVKANAVDDHDS